MMATKIRINYLPRHYELDESCPLDSAWEFNCVHPETHMEDTSSFYPDHRGEPVEVKGEVEVCDTCDESLEEL